MKTLFLLTYYTPHWTGLTQYARRLAEGLAKRKHTVTVLTTNYTGNLTREETIKSVHIVRKRVLFRLSRTLISISFLFSFFRYIKQTDVVIVYLPFAEVLFAAIVAKIFRKKMYLVHNGDLSLPKGLLKKPLEFFYHVSTDLAIRLSEGIFVQSIDYSMHSPLLAKHKKKWQVVFPLYEVMPENKKAVVTMKKKIPKPNKEIIGFAGRFVEEKGFDILVQAIPAVSRKYPESIFVFAGAIHMEYENFYEKIQPLIDKVKNKIYFIGTLTQQQMGTFYRLCDLFVISSRTDCFPSTEVESLLCQTPVVVTNIPGARVPVKKTGMGIIVESEDPHSLAQGIMSALQKKRVLLKHKKKVVKLFDYEKTMSQYEKVLLKK